MLEIDNPPRFRSYLLRCWQEQSGDALNHRIWRYSLEDPHTGQRRGFATLEALVALLRADELIPQSVADRGQQAGAPIRENE